MLNIIDNTIKNYVGSLLAFIYIDIQKKAATLCKMKIDIFNQNQAQ